MIYDAFRTNGGPTQYAPNPSAVTVDVLEIGFICAVLMLFICFALTIPGYKGISSMYFTMRIVISLFIGSAILLGVLGHEWEKAEIVTRTPYKAFANREITAHIGIKIGLGAVNITLKGDPVHQNLSTSDNVEVVETINYNERFNWAWRQGRIGFGPYAGRISREFRAAQYRGIPLPILWVAEYFTLDGELIRWGRSYRTAGWYTNEVLWTSFPLWVLANIMTFMVLFYAGWMFVLTGLCMLTSTIIWATIKWGYQPLVIPFEDAHLSTHYGPSFWLVIGGGIVSIIYGIVIVVMDFYFKRQLAEYFGHDILRDTDDISPKTEEPEMGTQENTGGVRKRIIRATQRRYSRRPRSDLYENITRRRSIVDNDERITTFHGAAQRKSRAYIQNKPAIPTPRSRDVQSSAGPSQPSVRYESRYAQNNPVYEDTIVEEQIYVNL